MADDVAFTFDPNPILSGIKRVSDGMGSMTKSITSGILKAASILGVLALAFKGIKSTLREMPEIGEAFGIAKDVFMKNFLWPLRQAVMPLLQKMLDWVRDNRTAFIKWGRVVANIFQSVVMFLGRVIETAKLMFESIGRVFDKIFGGSLGKLDEIVNILLFKIASAVEFIGIAIQPVFAWMEQLVMTFMPKIIDLFNTIWGFLSRLVSEVGPPLVDLFQRVIIGALDSIVSLLDGFFSNIGGIEISIGNIVGWFKQLIDNLLTANERGDSLLNVFETIGGFAADIFKWIADMVDKFMSGFVPAVRNIATPLQNIVDNVKEIFNDLFGGTEAISGWEKIFKDIGSTLGDAVMKTLQLIALTIKAIGIGIQWVLIQLDKFNKSDIGKFLNFKETRGMTPFQALFGNRDETTSSVPPSNIDPSQVVPTYNMGSNRQTVTVNQNITVTPENAETTLYESFMTALDEMRTGLQAEQTRQGQ